MIAAYSRFSQTSLLVALIILLSFATLTQAHAEEELERYTEVSILGEKTALRPADEITIATHIKLAPHWHVYWENPGDSGLPVKINWKMPDGFEISAIEWPTPDKISYDILANYGYYNEVVLLQKLKVPDTLPEGSIPLEAKVDMLVCNDICIPESSTVTLDLNHPENLAEDNTDFITAARDRLAPKANGIFSFSEADNKLVLSLKPEDMAVLNDATAENIEFFPVEWGIINHVAIPDVTLADGVVTIAHERGDQPLSDKKSLRGLLVIKGAQGQNKGFSLEVKQDTDAKNVVVNPNNQQDKLEQVNAQKSNEISWFGALYLALIGGLILNLMPCVFPVLSMKALSLVKMNDKEKALARRHGLAYTFGVILSFLAIGGVLIVLKEAGSAVGWGFQLQNPMIVALLAYLLFLIGLNLIGFFEFGSGLGNVGNKLTQGSSLSGSFFTGMLATIVATPCTAPFMGTAMGYAVTQPTLISMSVFAALGFGLALPYLVLSYVPALRKVLPRPGAWMDKFKQFLAFPIFASSIWLVWVLSEQSGSYGVLLVLLGMLAIAFCVWLSHFRNEGTARFIVRTLFILALFLPFLSLSYIKSTEQIVASMDKSYMFGESFSEEKLSAFLKGDEPLFVEMTAAWCITCKLNHALAINSNSTKKLFAEKNIRYLIGDWTNYDDEITKYLDKFGRNGVPLYVYYGPRNKATGKRPDPIVLPQVLSPSSVQEVVK